MQKILFLVVFLCSFSKIGYSQKFGYMDSEYILVKLPEYKKAQEKMNEITLKWTDEIQTKSSELDKLKLKFQQEEVIMTAEMRKEKLSELQKMEQDIKILNTKVFGLDGELFQKKKEIMKPVMDEIYKSADRVSRKYKLSFLFDKASDLVMFYADPRHDYTDYIMEDLGLTQKK
ncbi:MAG: OmpH family outer membrane protein [Leadbetterella sp.]